MIMDMNSRYKHSYINLNDGEFSFINWGGSGHLTHISHSIGYCAGVYTPLTKKLNHTLKLVGLDNRGHGNTKAPANHRKLRDWNIFYDDLECFFKYLNQPLIAIGHSMGGTISMVAAIRQPDLVRALILIEPGIMPPSWVLAISFLQKFGLTWIVPAVSKTAKRRSEWLDRESLKSYLSGKELFCNWEREFFDAFIDYIVEETDAGKVRLRCDPRWEARCIASAPTDIWNYVPKLKTPTLVVYGTKTQTFLPNVIERFASEVPHSVFKCFVGSGHNVIMERPDEFAETIIDFLRGNKII